MQRAVGDHVAKVESDSVRTDDAARWLGQYSNKLKQVAAAEDKLQHLLNINPDDADQKAGHRLRSW